MDEIENLSVHVAEYIKDRLYFATLHTPIKPRCSATVHYFTIDNELLYESFYSDFGPLNLAKLYRYCNKLNIKLQSYSLMKKKIVHYTTQDSKKRVNAAFLIGSYAIIFLKMTSAEAYQPLIGNNSLRFIPFRDASYGQCTYNLTLKDCLDAVNKALKNKFLNFESFDIEEYEFCEKVENGDLNWIVPNKFLAFCGPHARSKFENGYPIHAPESYISYFQKNNVSAIVRLNKKIYEAHRFTNHGFQHYDMFFVDGSTPSDKIMYEFLEIAEEAKGAIAVHCKAGLGRTGTLIACYIMKHHHFTAAEAIAWIRICRPGSIIGHQQHWLEEKEVNLCYQGNIFRAAKANVKNSNTPTKILTRASTRRKEDVTQILAKVDEIRLDDKPKIGNVTSRSRKEKSISSRNNNDNNNNNNIETGDIVTQGDKLNRIKAMRRQPRSHTTCGMSFDNLKPHPRSSSQPFKSPPSSSGGATYISPLKPLRPPLSPTQTLSASHSHLSPVRQLKGQKPPPPHNRRRNWRQQASPGSSHSPPSRWDLSAFLGNNNHSLPVNSFGNGLPFASDLRQSSAPQLQNGKNSLMNGNISR